MDHSGRLDIIFITEMHHVQEIKSVNNKIKKIIINQRFASICLQCRETIYWIQNFAQQSQFKPILLMQCIQI